MGKNTEKSFRPAILVADDDKVMQSIFSYHLKKTGYEVDTANDGREAIDMISENTAVLLLDIHMPVMDGMTCLRHIRERFEYVSVIMVTASDDISDAVEAMKYGASDYLVKPVNPRELVTLVEKNIINFMRNRKFRQMEQDLAKARKRELDILSKIQKTMLMANPPKNTAGVRIAHLSVPSQKVDGDFFDFYKIRDDYIDILVGDVMGKGIAAALLGAAVKSHFLRAMNELLLSNKCKNFPEPADIVDWAHSEIICHLKEIEAFVTLCYARIDLKNRCICFVDCGHVPIIHYHHSSGRITMLEGVNVPLGISDPDPIEQLAVPFQPGDFFFLYSDGLTEAENPQGELFGEDRLADTIRKNAENDPQDLVSAVQEEVIRFSGSEVFKDDFTCVVAAIER